MIGKLERRLRALCPQSSVRAGEVMMQALSGPKYILFSSTNMCLTPILDMASENKNKNPTVCSSSPLCVSSL